LGGYIEGATDFIFGRRGYAYFAKNTLAVKAKGWITASGRESNDGSSCMSVSLSGILVPSNWI